MAISTLPPALPPANTVVILPKPLPMNRGAFWMLFWTIGLLMGLFVRALIGEVETPGRSGPNADTSYETGWNDGVNSAQITSAQAIPSPVFVLQLPTPLPTSTPRPTSVPTSGPSIDACDKDFPDPGDICMIPRPAAPTPTPYPDCSSALATPTNGGTLCRWPQQFEMEGLFP